MRAQTPQINWIYFRAMFAVPLESQGSIFVQQPEVERMANSADVILMGPPQSNNASSISVSGGAHYCNSPLWIIYQLAAS